MGLFETLSPGTPDGRQVLRRVIVSAGLHAAVIAAIAVALHAMPMRVAPYRLPGSPHGRNFLLSYLPDRAPEQSAAAHPGPQPVAKTRPTVAAPVARPAKPLPAATANTHASPDPNAVTGADALGSGNISIALTKYFPPPQPDLSALPAGTRGDVILDVVIGTNGRIAQCTMLSGLGHGVDETVIATVQQWIFRPALRNGQPVASEQELHFHYARG